ncbi:MAG: hypothetical protein OEV42_02225 [Deltaproteobacteria bacterium]|nr:hypothetical protein [Deltaproteobacteria bacterium]
MNHSHFKLISAALIAGAVLLTATSALAASCCGGGSAASLLLPKISKAMSNATFDYEQYKGYWDKSGSHQDDPEGANYKQYRLNLGYGLRLADRWQGSISLPYVYNDNKYADGRERTNGLGDVALGFWYENFDDIKCVWKVRSAADLIPAAYFGATLTIPTGISPYDDIDKTEDITGRGVYRLDGTMLLDKTIYPWNISAQFTYGTHAARPVNRKNGKYIEPYDLKLGDRYVGTFSLGYTHFLESMDSLTFTAAYTDLTEEKETIDGHKNDASGMSKKSVSATVAFSTMNRNWVYKATWSHGYEGENFPKTDIISIGVSHVYR